MKISWKTEKPSWLGENKVGKGRQETITPIKSYIRQTRINSTINLSHFTLKSGRKKPGKHLRNDRRRGGVEAAAPASEESAAAFAAEFTLFTVGVAYTALLHEDRRI